MKYFSPDLIIEVTSACNRSCVGCYAPNVILKSGNLDTEYLKTISLSMTSIEKALTAIGDDLAKSAVIAIRGGEPTLNPDLPQILTLLPTNSKKFLETNGNWILSHVLPVAQKDTLLNSLVHSKTCLKISYDTMHKSRPEQLRQQIEFLKQKGIAWCLAITAAREDDCLPLLAEIPFINTNLVFFQRLAHKIDDLVKPSLGVIDTKGNFKTSVTAHSHFYEATEVS